DSSSAVYNVDGFHTTGTWNNINRNITHDLNASLGLHSWNLTRIVLYVNGEASGRISVLFDEIHIQDMKGPEIQSVSLSPTTPEYHETASIDIEATDNIAIIDVVNVFYRDDTSWVTVEAGYNFGKWTATLPELAYGLERQYYVEVSDTSGRQDTDDNEGAYYSYSSSDSVEPTVTISSPGEGITVEGDVQFEIAAEDPGSGSSGMAYLEVWEGEMLIYNETSAPFEFTWDSRMTSNGTKDIGSFAYDTAGNIATDNITIDIQNDVAPPLLYGLQVNPTAPEDGEKVTVSLVCSDVSGVENATLYYAVEDTTAFSGAQSWTVVNMSPVGMLYSGSIPAQEYGKTVLYYVVAYDTFGQEASIGSDTAPLSYDVADTQDPTMNVYAPSSSQPVRGIVAFNITANDAASGISEIQFYVDGSLVDDSSGDAASFEWDTTTLENGDYTVTFVAIDGAGNEVSSSIEYEVINPDAFGAFGESLYNIMAWFGLFIGLAGGIALVLVVQALLKKRGK
ncbi:MAG: Ig-like domain-containing protein, partial [Candidatus Thorarchaeota archaeon]